MDAITHTTPSLLYHHTNLISQCTIIAQTIVPFWYFAEYHFGTCNIILIKILYKNKQEKLFSFL